MSVTAEPFSTSAEAGVRSLSRNFLFPFQKDKKKEMYCLHVEPGIGLKFVQDEVIKKNVCSESVNVALKLLIFYLNANICGSFVSGGHSVKHRLQFSQSYLTVNSDFLFFISFDG